MTPPRIPGGDGAALQDRDEPDRYVVFIIEGPDAVKLAAAALGIGRLAERRPRREIPEPSRN